MLYKRHNLGDFIVIIITIIIIIIRTLILWNLWHLQ